VDGLLQIAAFRTFSRTVTWAAVRDILGRYPTLDDLADGSFGRGVVGDVPVTDVIRTLNHRAPAMSL
jgi:hypothetical protein